MTRLRHGDTFDRAYFFFALKGWEAYLKGQTSGSGIPHVDKEVLGKLKILKFPKPEQTKIAEILSTVDRAIEQTEALIAKQQRLKTGLMQDLLTCGIDEHGNLRSEQTHPFKDSPLGRIPVEWEVKPIETKLECIIDYRGRTPVKTDSGIPLITAKNVREGFLCEEPREFIATDAYDSWMTRGIPEPGDVMITTEAPMGNVARVPDYKIALAQRLITLPTKKNELSSDFLFWTLHWSRTLERLELLTSGSTVVGIKQSVFRKVEFGFPPLEEQSKITALLNAERDTAETNLKHLAKLRSLKTALMQDLLTGRKRVTTLLDGKEDSA
jgi:type I restriction enzyme S subunit